MTKPRRRPEKPLHRQVAEFVCWQLADKRAFSPFTGTDYDAWHAYIHLIRLWGRTRSDDVVAALRAVVHTAQTRHDDVMAVFKKAIPCLLDWSDEPKLWSKIGPRRKLDDVTTARIRRGIDKHFESFDVTDVTFDGTEVTWPCADGPRVCHHENSKPYKHATPEPGYTDEKECRDCGAIWRDKIVSTT